MKKFVAALTLFLACAFSASAQEQKLTADEMAKIEAHQISENLGLKGQQQEDFIVMMVQKHRITSDPQMSDLRKAEITRGTEARLRAMLTPDQLRKLEGSGHLTQGPAAAAPTVKSAR